MYKVGICGHFGEGKNLLNGQTVKTRILTEELRKKIGENQVTILDSYGWIKKPISLFLGCLKLVRKSENIIILPATRGIKVFVPIFTKINKLYHRNLHYVVIGGWLPDMLKKQPRLIKQLSCFKGIYVETHKMIKSLNILGLNNVYYLPNFKSLKILSENELFYQKEEPFSLCTFSRVMPEKGIEDAIEAVKKANNELNRIVYTLDIYGQIDRSYEEKFERLKKYFPSFVKYKGTVQFNESTDVLKKYFALIFPTKYEGEGFPGTIIDSLSAGVPVIASNWKYNNEVVSDGRNGIIYGNGIDDLVKVLIKLACKPDIINSMKKNCINNAKNYNAEIVVEKFMKNF